MREDFNQKLRMMEDEMNREILKQVRKEKTQPWKMLWWAGIMWCVILASILSYSVGAFVTWDFLWLSSRGARFLFVAQTIVIIPPLFALLRLQVSLVSDLKDTDK